MMAQAARAAEGSAVRFPRTSAAILRPGCYCPRGPNDFAIAGLVALVCVIGSLSPTRAQTLGPLVQVAAGDPFSECVADNVKAQKSAFGSILYRATSIEPWV